MSRDATFTPRSLGAPEYIEALFEPADNVAILVRNRGTGRTVQRIATAARVASPQFQQWLAAESARGSDIYLGMNPIKDGAQNRTKESVKDIRHVYLDLDRNGDESLETIRNAPSVPPPNFVLDTSPGKHQVVWKVSGFTQDEAESLLRSLSNEFGGDPAATDSTRVLRLPGFENHKLSEPFVVRAQQESGTVHTPRDFAVPADSPGAPRRWDGSHSRAMPSDHKSQSERDWAYAKRALARGDDPEDIIRRIADFRSDDKPDPNYYARHTVANAMADREHKQADAKPPAEAPLPNH
jgi:hypothetical protein